MSLYPVNTVSHSLRRIRRISHLMVLACWLLVLLLPVALVVHWAGASTAELAHRADLAPGTLLQPLQAWQRWIAGSISAIPLGLLLVGVWQAKRCFEQFAQGLVFTEQATGLLRRFAGWVAAAALAAILCGAAISVLLTLHNPPGMRMLSVSISSQHVFTSFFAGLVWLMAAVIGQGQALAEENEHFV
ncbi:DUF2975 domain-containing protein [Hydrogenophaga sp.]|uniref:DUF2975 domain-containing protein n=1 Tax=Hydrogenophaga sp. TaxID=1904254 RepID=UPI003566F4DD